MRLEIKLVGSFWTLYADGNRIKESTDAGEIDSLAARIKRDNDATTIRRYVSVTPDDNTDLAEVPDELRCSVGGDVAVYFEGDGTSTALTQTLVAGGVGTRMRVARVLQTNTTATGIEAVYYG